MSFETCPKNVAETVACIGFANAKARSRVTNVDSWSRDVREAKLFADMSCESDVERREEEDTGCKRQVVVKVLNSGVDDEATAWYSKTLAVLYARHERTDYTSTYSLGLQVTVLT